MYVTTGTCFYCITVLLNSARTRGRFTKLKKKKKFAGSFDLGTNFQNKKA